MARKWTEREVAAMLLHGKVKRSAGAISTKKYRLRLSGTVIPYQRVPIRHWSTRPKTAFGKVIRRICSHYNISIPELARKTGISATSIYQAGAKSGWRRNIRPFYIDLIAQTLKLSTHERMMLMNAAEADRGELLNEKATNRPRDSSRTIDIIAVVRNPTRRRLSGPL